MQRDAGWDSLEAEAELRWPTPDVMSGAGDRNFDILTVEPSSRLSSALPAHAAPVVAPPALTPPPARPASPTSVEKMASMLRSLSFAATQPRSASEAGRAQQFQGASAMLQRELFAGHVQRLLLAAPALAQRLVTALTSTCGVLLGAENTEAGFEWASQELDELRRQVPANDGVFPGDYYRQIFDADVAALYAAVAAVRREASRRERL